MPSLRNRFRETADKLRSLGGSTDALDRRISSVVERATCEMMINPDWGVNMELVDIINSHPNAICYDKVFRSIRRRLSKPSPEIRILAFTLLETCVKNTGTEFHEALSVSEFWDEILRFADPKKNIDLQVQDKVLILVEDCAYALQPSGYKQSYETLRNWGARFPTRPLHEIGAGFNLPPPRSDSNLINGVSETNQHVVQGDLQEVAPPPQELVPVAVQETPQVDETAAEKIKSDLQIAVNTISVLKETVAAISSMDPSLVQQDYVSDIRQQCIEIAPKLKELISSSNDEEILVEALFLNDELEETLTRYDQVAEKAKKAAKEALKQEPDMLSFNETVQTSYSNSMIDPFDELVSLRPAADPNQVTTSNRSVQPSRPVKNKDPFEDLLTF
eukprot:g6063.t1